MKILVIQYKMIGDVLASSILCNNLRKIYPNAQIDYLVYPYTIAVLENNPNIDNLILFHDNYVANKKDLFSFLRKIRKQKYDMVVDAYGKLESYLVVAASGASVKIGWEKPYSKLLYTQTFKEVCVAKTDAGLALENRLLLLSEIAKDITLDAKPVIYLTEEEIASAKKTLEQHGISSSEKTYMISVLGSGDNKTYPFAYMAEILDFIVEKTNATLLFNYIPSQLNQAKEIYDLCENATKEKIRLELVPGNLREFMSIAYHCDALIGNEGGAVNMAKAINVPTFTIFSTWIKKEAWNSFEDGTTHVSVHLKDFKPELYGDKHPKELKEKAFELYEKFIPDFIKPKLKNYLEIN